MKVLHGSPKDMFLVKSYRDLPMKVLYESRKKFVNESFKDLSMKVLQRFAYESPEEICQ